MAKSLGVVVADVAVAVAFALITGVVSTMVVRKRRKDSNKSAYETLISEESTPMIRLHRLSLSLGRSLWVKMENMNPGGTGKDRAALNMLQHAEESGMLPPPIWQQQQQEQQQQQKEACDGSSLIELVRIAVRSSRSGGLVVEGTSGSTGISLATLCAARGHACVVVMPDDQALEKQRILSALGAVVHVVPNCAISNPNHYVNVARDIAERARSEWNTPALFVNQFENEANFLVHYHKTGPEISKQCPGNVNAFVMSSGTGGTIAGVGKHLKETTNGKVLVVLVDPPGSALYHRIKHGVAYAPQQQERAVRRHRYDTLAEGIGLDRITHNFSLGMDCIDDAIRVSDQEAVDMAHYLLQTEGLWVGSSSAMNVVGAVRTALKLPSNANIVTIVCDSGQRHVTRFWNPDFIREWGLEWPQGARIPQCLQEVARS